MTTMPKIAAAALTALDLAGGVTLGGLGPDLTAVHSDQQNAYFNRLQRGMVQ